MYPYSLFISFSVTSKHLSMVGHGTRFGSGTRAIMGCGTGLTFPFIGTVAYWIGLLLPAIFVLVIVFGYLGLTLIDIARSKRTV
jgi:hypothetical protein